MENQPHVALVYLDSKVGLLGWVWAPRCVRLCNRAQGGVLRLANSQGAAVRYGAIRGTGMSCTLRGV